MVHVQGLGKRRIAVIDLGTNTFHLLIADLDPDKNGSLVFQKTIAVRLGEGGINQGYIAEAAFERGIKAVSEFKKCIDQHDCDEIRTAATSALRTARNGALFIDEILRLTDIPLRVIDGQEEARLIYEGVKKAVGLGKISLIMDIGGGSVEFIIANQEQIYWKNSFPIGAARLMDRFHHSDPISAKDTQLIQKHLDDVLPELHKQVAKYEPPVLVGSAGAFETFALFQNEDFEPGFYTKSLNFDLEEYHRTSAFITSSSHTDRQNDPRIAAVREDMIVVATILTDYILARTGIKQMQLSTYSLKEGLLLGEQG